MVDEKTEDTILENEIVKNERIVSHPRLGKFGAVRLKFSRPTPRIEALITEERRKIWHRDLKDESILSRKEVEAMLIRRGVWSKEDTEKVSSLSSKSGELMSRLHALGFVSLPALSDGLEDVLDGLLQFFVDKPEIRAAVERIFNLDMPLAVADLKMVRDSAPSTEVDDLVEKAENIRMQLELAKEMGEIRGELNEALRTHAEWFGSTLEARAEAAERMATMFYCITHADSGQRLWKSMEEMQDTEPSTLTWLQTQLFYFQNGITSEFAEVLEAHGFTPRGNGSENESAS